MSAVGSLIVWPKSARFERDHDVFSKMDPFIVVRFDGESKQTETATKQGKTPSWSSQLTFALREEHLNRPETQIIVEAYDDDGKNKKEFIGVGTFKFSEVRNQSQVSKTLTVYDKKNKQKGVVQLEIGIKKDTRRSESPTKASNQSPAQTQKPGTIGESTKKRGALGKGTLVVRPRTARLKRSTDVIGKTDPYVVVILNDKAFKTDTAEAGSKNPIWKDALSYELKGTEDVVIFRVMDADTGSADDLIGEALVNLDYIAQNLIDNSAEITINLEYKSKDAGQLTLEFEYSNEIIGNAAKFYPPIEIKRGEYICKKIKYSNPDNFQKTLVILTADQTNLVQPRTAHVTVNAKSYAEIRLKVFAPNHSTEANARLDIFVEELNEVEESLIFRLRGF